MTVNRIVLPTSEKTHTEMQNIPKTIKKEGYGIRLYKFRRFEICL
jgi:hypothetical protein